MMPVRQTFLTIMGAGVFLLGFGVFALPVAGTEPDRELLQPLPDLNTEQLLDFFAGQVEFSKGRGRNDGLGPIFNANHCADCHRNPEVLGTGPRYKSVMTFGATDEEFFNPLVEEGGPVLQERSLSRDVPLEPLPFHANALSLRKVPMLYGLGLVEAIPDEAILALADPDDIDGDGISGRAVVTAEGHVQRIASQNFSKSVLDFVKGALEAEIGITPAEAGPDLAPLIRNFITYSSPIEPLELSDRAKLGERVFNQVGCASCHTPAFTTSSGPFRTPDGETIDVDALKGKHIVPFSDFLLHDMGPTLDDGVALGQSTSAEYRTTPLWGYRFRRGAALHDGRATDARQIIMFHDGEARASRQAYLRLTINEQNALREFMNSL